MPLPETINVELKTDSNWFSIPLHVHLPRGLRRNPFQYMDQPRPLVGLSRRVPKTEVYKTIAITLVGGDYAREADGFYREIMKRPRKAGFIFTEESVLDEELQEYQIVLVPESHRSERGEFFLTGLIVPHRKVR